MDITSVSKKSEIQSQMKELGNYKLENAVLKSHFFFFGVNVKMKSHFLSNQH